MRLSRHLTGLFALLLAAGAATAQAPDGQWLSYRDAYRAMVVFDKYGKPKNFIQHHLQVMPRERGVGIEGLQLSVQGKTIQLNLPLDPTGRAVFPLLKAAYDENAALVLNRKSNQYLFRSRVSIVVRPDGVYEGGELRAACEQALAYQAYRDASLGAKKCVGVRFAFARTGVEPAVKLRKSESEQASLPVTEGAAFADDPNDGFKTVTVRFGETPERAQVVTHTAPLSIAALYE